MLELSGMYIIWLRDVKRFWRDKVRIIGAMAQPTLFLFIIGTGLGRAFLREGRQYLGAEYIKFIYPGIIGMTILFTSVFSAISIIWDREFGFLKEVLVAPISRSSVALGKAFGGTTVAMFQGTIMLIYAPFVGVELTWLMVAKLWFLMFLISFSLTSMGIVIAARMKSMEGFQMIMNFLLMPIFFLSGAIFPLKNLPAWLDCLVRIDPLAYGIDALRGVIIGIWQYPFAESLLIIIVFGLAMIFLAVFEFNRQE